MEWTSEQLAALDIHNQRNLIVSASAGSGKTTVLIERVLKLIIQKEVSISNILMITFTNKSARDMRQKLKETLEEVLDSESPMYVGKRYSLSKEALEDKIRFLTKERNLTDSADIKTIDAFCFKVVKSHFNQLNLDLDIKILDNYVRDNLENEALDQLFEEEFGVRNPHFLNIVNLYGEALKDNKLRSILKDLYGFSQSNDNPERWLDHSLISYIDSVKAFEDSPLGKFLRGRYLDIELPSLLNPWRELLREEANLATRGEPEYHKLYQTDYEIYQEVIALLKERDISVIFEARDIPHPAQDTILKKKTKDIQKEFVQNRRAQKSIKTGIKKILNMDLSASLKLMVETRPDIEYLIAMTKKYGEILLKLKKEKNAFDYNDITHFCLDLLENSELVRQEYQNYYRYILFDEYQDTNKVQDRIFRLLSQKDNMFYVGDKKQSIYRFRLADSSIFEQTITEFQESDTDESLMLNQNFRSSPGVVDGVNGIFNHLMDGKISSVQYKEEASLVYGSPRFTSQEPLEVYLCKADAVDGEEENSEEEEREESLDLEDYKTSNQIYQEAQICAKKIRALVDSGKAQYKDFVLLSYSVKGLIDGYKEVFDLYDIPIFGESDARFLQSLSVHFVMDFLEIINNSNRDIPLINVLKGPRYRFTLEELATIRLGTGNRISLQASLRKYLEYQPGSHSIKEKIKFFQRELKELKEELPDNNLVDFIIKLLFKTEYYYTIFRKADYEEEALNLKEILRLAMEFEKINTRHLSGFIQYFKSIKTNDLHIPVSSLSSEDANVVKIQTIHKSKGLQYKNVFLVGLGKNFRAGRSSSCKLHKDLGFGGKWYNPMKNTREDLLSKKIIGLAEGYESKEDYLNLLYVAMTRAEDRLYLVGSVKNLEKRMEVWEKNQNEVAKEGKSFFDFLMPLILFKQEVASLYSLSIVEKEAIQSEPRKTRVLQAGLRKIQSINREFQQIPKKLSATDFLQTDSMEGALSRDLLRNELKHKPAFLSEQQLTRAEQGILFHLVMEILDFDREYDEEQLRKVLKDLLEQTVITPQEYEVLDIYGIIKFLTSPLYQRLQAGDYYEKEKAFNLLVDPRKIFPDYRGDQSLMVQGILDLYFVEGKQGILIDFKTDRVTKSEAEARVLEYRKQLHLYKMALEEIKGLEVKESYLYFSHLGEFIPVEL